VNRRLLLVLAAVMGLGLVAAPAIFQMFSRAPEGGDMINDFRPYMTDETVEKFQGYMAEIDAAEVELRTKLSALLDARADVTADDFTSITRFDDAWPGIDADMGDDLLVRMDQMVPNFEAVDALPPFPLFPWFFVGPGVLVAAVAAIGLWRERQGRSPRPYAVALAALGVAVVLAPAVFQMFSRAPKGAEMIDVFRPMMTTARVTTVQGYFLTIGAAEGEWRTQVSPLLNPSDLPAVERFSSDWPRISNDFAPMIGAMSDNVDNYAAVDALPSFSLFPWFFVVPGLLIGALGVGAARARAAEASTDDGV
jgi:hypothetical protein